VKIQLVQHCAAVSTIAGLLFVSAFGLYFPSAKPACLFSLPYVELTVCRATCVDRWQLHYVLRHVLCRALAVVCEAWPWMSRWCRSYELLSSFHVYVLHGWAYFMHCIASMHWELMWLRVQIIRHQILKLMFWYCYKIYWIRWSITLCSVGSNTFSAKSLVDM